MGKSPALSERACGKGSLTEPTQMWEKFSYPEQRTMGRCPPPPPMAEFPPGSTAVGIRRYWKNTRTVSIGGLKETDTVYPMTPDLWEGFPYSCLGEGCAVGLSVPETEGVVRTISLLGARGRLQ